MRGILPATRDVQILHDERFVVSNALRNEHEVARALGRNNLNVARFFQSIQQLLCSDVDVEVSSDFQILDKNNRLGCCVLSLTLMQKGKLNLFNNRDEPFEVSWRNPELWMLSRVLRETDA